MKQIVYCMQFKGAAAPAGAEPGVLKTTTSAASCNIKTVVGSAGVEAEFHATEGGMAYFESEVRLTAQDAFVESGTITFGEDRHSLQFSTVGQGYLNPTPDSQAMAGTVTWKVEKGEGQFEGASGLITSNFTLGNDGQVIDHHVGVIFVK